MSYETRYAATMRQRRYERDNSPAAIAERAAHKKAMELVRADVEAKFPVITLENGRDALAYQQDRIEHHLNAVRAGAAQ